MKIALRSVLIFALMTGGAALAQEASSNRVSFVPPKDGPPAGRVGAGTRSADKSDGGLIKLVVPAGGGQTALTSLS